LRKGRAPVVRRHATGDQGGVELLAHEGEVVGLAGLAGHGQTETLVAIFESAAAQRAGVAFVAGDRQSDGIFPLWTIAKNISAASLRQLRQAGLVSEDQERALANLWRERIGIRTPDVAAPILSLSGGNQQKALFARALASDAKIILMDDPMRGVDIGTKQDVYAIVRQEAARGRTFLWYTTEMDELRNCDHVYVFRERRIVADLSRADLTEEKVLHASFEAEAA
jgi:ribose transport system ATP-binding protein